MPAISAHFAYEIKLFGLCITEQTLNVFHYATTGIVDCDVNDLLAAFKAEVSDNLTSIAATEMSYYQITAQEILGGVQFGSLAVSNNGIVSGDCLPPFNAWDFTYVRGGARERNGYKRMAGVPEAMQAQGIITGGSLPAVNAAAGHMAADIVASTITFHPAILRRRINHIIQTTPQLYSISGVNYSKIGSQNSRKFGHGR